MSTIPRLNGVIRALETGQVAFSAFVNPDVESPSPRLLHQLPYDGVVFEGEAQPLGHPGVAGLAPVPARSAASSSRVAPSHRR